MPQLVKDASIFRRVHREATQEIRRAKGRDTLGDLSKVMGVAGQASDLIDKLGNNELAKVAAARIHEQRRKAAIEKDGQPVLDLDYTERNVLTQEAIERVVTPKTELQDPTEKEQAGPYQGLLMPGSTRSGLPGELHVPLPGEQPQQPEMPLQAAPAAAQTPLGGMAQPGALGGQQLQDPSMAISALGVADEHLSQPLQIKSQSHAIALARLHGDDPMLMMQLVEGVDRYEGISPQGMWGLQKGTHLRDAQREIMKAGAMARAGKDKHGIAVLKMLKLQLANEQDPLKRRKLEEQIWQMIKRGYLVDAQTVITHDKFLRPERYKGKGIRINTYLGRGKATQAKKVPPMVQRDKDKAEAARRTAENRVITNKAKIAESVARQKSEKKALDDLTKTGGQRHSESQSRINKLKTALRDAGAARGPGELGTAFSKFPQFNLGNKKESLAAAAARLKSMQSEMARDQSMHRKSITKIRANIGVLSAKSAAGLAKQEALRSLLESRTAAEGRTRVVYDMYLTWLGEQSKPRRKRTVTIEEIIEMARKNNMISIEELKKLLGDTE